MLMLMLGIFPTITLGYHMGEVINLLIQSSSSSSSSSLLSSFHDEKNAKNIDALRNQMPLFGISSSASIDPATLQLLPTMTQQQLQRQKIFMTMVFGGKRIPSITVYGQEEIGSSNDGNHDEKMKSGSGSKILDSLIITFTYSTHTRRGNEGDIHSISISEANYADFDFKTKTKTVREEGGGRDDSSRIQVKYEWIEDADLDMPSGIVLMECVVLLTLLLIFIRVCATEDEDEGTGNKRHKRD
eukprot:CAMPEP_0198260288 /NCGR_PEP_ID=MMETSP1447-20131203/9301_1 /TAXON_ID=420782 /ORGANISM="Chaetoceros dichaeta, Strain CCMP1751" /LENGTH=242 /DNA_ID=CAMNT_0043947917 /DNA_START=150 /DNA_END=878 /DNA_ORIENTATION=-